VQCRRLVKGYSDTHERGDSKYQRLRLAASQLLGTRDAAAQLRVMREAALADSHGEKLDRLMAQAGLTARL
jgi:indolepyruvate ferredoxin oxidoreductase beta subunit